MKSNPKLFVYIVTKDHCFVRSFLIPASVVTFNHVSIATRSEVTTQLAGLNMDQCKLFSKD
jgi:hypothetical protein